MDKGKRAGSDPKNLYQRDGVWYGRVTVGTVEHRRSLKTRNRREAERRLSQWLKERSPYHGTVRHTFKEAATLWLEAGSWKPKTAAGYAKLMTGLLAHFGDDFWDQVDKAALQVFMQAKIASGAKMATVNRYLTVVSGIASHVKELPGWPEVNPVALLSRKNRKEKRQPYIRPPASDIDAMLARTTGTFRDLATLALLCGARKDELTFLTRNHAMGGTATFYDTKSGVPRTVPWVPEAQRIVDRQPVVKGSPFLFNTRNGGRYQRVTEMWRETVKRAQTVAQREGHKLTPMRFHDLRHEYAIRYLETGGSLYTLQKLLGHGSIVQTEWYLAYLTPEQADRARAATAQTTAQ